MSKPFDDVARDEFLAGRRVAVLSVAAGDGRPPASVPIWYDYAPGGDFRVTTGAGRRKARLIEQAGAVTLLVHREELPYQYVIVEGTVVGAETPSPTDARLAIAARYLGEEEARKFVDGIDGNTSVLFTIRPDRWITADFSS